MFRASTKAAPASTSNHFPQANIKGKDEGWSNPFGGLANGANDRHPSWSASGGVRERGSGGVESKAKGTSEGDGEKAQQGGIGGTGDGGSVGSCDDEHEAGVWVGWGGGCAF